MADLIHGTQYDPSTEARPSITPAGAQLVTLAGETVSIPGLQIPTHDYISLGYTGQNVTSVIYKTGGSGGTVVATLTLGYSGSDLISVTKT